MTIFPSAEPFTRLSSFACEFTPASLLICDGLAVISTPPTCNLVALISPLEPYITALSNIMASLLPKYVARRSTVIVCGVGGIMGTIRTDLVYRLYYRLIPSSTLLNPVFHRTKKYLIDNESSKLNLKPRNGPFQKVGSKMSRKSKKRFSRILSPK